MFSSASSRLPYFAKYFKHDTAKECVKEMYKKDTKGKIVLQFFSAALDKSDWQKNDEIKRLLNRAVELLEEKKVSQKVTDKFKKIKPLYKKKLKIENQQKEEKANQVKQAQQELKEKKKVEKAKKEEEQEKLRAQADLEKKEKEELVAAKKKEFEEKFKRQKQQADRLAEAEKLKQQAIQAEKKRQEREKLEEDKKQKELKRLESERLIREKQEQQRLRAEKLRVQKERLSQNAKISENPVQDISLALYDSILETRDELIRKELYEGDDIACMMDEPYEATIDLAILKILQKSFIEAGGHVVVANAAEEYVFRLQPGLNKQEIRLKLTPCLHATSNFTAEQHESLYRRLLRKDNFVTDNEKNDLPVTQAFNAIVGFRIESIEQNVMHMNGSKENDQQMNLRSAFEGILLNKHN
jgi:hypothetical protein